MRNVYSRMILIACLAAVGVAMSWPGHAAGLQAKPDSVSFTKTDQTHTVQLTVDGKPLPASSVTSVRFMATGSDYIHMMKVERADGALKLTPSATVEIGSYDLVIGTTAGTVTVKAYTPLSDMPDTQEKMAREMGVTVEQLKERLGLTAPLGRERVTVDLPSVYYEGDVLRLAMTPNPDREFVWEINGDVVLQGKGENELSYVFAKPGAYALSYKEKDGGATVASMSANTMVVERPALPIRVAAGGDSILQGPEGFAEYQWKIGGNVVATTRALTYNFATPGKIQVECIAGKPQAGPAGGFVRYVFDVTVS